MARHLPFAMALTALGCSASETQRFVETPGMGPEVQALIFSVGNSLAPVGGGAQELTAMDRASFAQMPLILEVDEEATLRLEALTYPDNLATLAIEPGVIRRPSGDEPTRPLPRPDQVLTRDEPGDGVWHLSEIQPELAARTIPALDPFACLERGACPGGEPLRCHFECQVPEAPLPPAAPDPPVRLGIFGCSSSTGIPGAFPGGVLTACEPRPPAQSCPSGSAQAPSSSSCQASAAPCPAHWPLELPAGPVLYVDAAALTGGDGQAATPFLRINEAIAQASSGTVIAIAAGQYPESVAVPAGVSLVGACAAGTQITSDVGLAVGADGPFLLRGLALRGDPALVLDGAAVGRLEDVALSGRRGIEARPGSQLDVDGLWAEGLEVSGLSLSGVATLRHGALIGGSGSALVAVGPAAQVSAEDLWIQGAGAAAVIGQDGARLTLARVVLEDSRGPALQLVGAEAEVTDLLVRDRRAGAVGDDAISVSGGAQLRGQRLVVFRDPGSALAATSSASATLQDLEVAELGGGMVAVNLGGRVELERARCQRSETDGLSAVQGGWISASDVELRACSTQADGSSVRAASGTIELTRALVDGGGNGVFTDGVDPVVRMQDVELGFLASGGIILTGIGDLVVGARIEIHDTGGSAIVGTGDTRVEMSELWARGATGTSRRKKGTVAFNEGAEVVLENFLIEDNLVAGLDIQGAASLGKEKTFRRGLVRRNPIGLYFDADPKFASIYLEQVRFEDNETLLGD